MPQLSIKSAEVTFEDARKLRLEVGKAYRFDVINKTTPYTWGRIGAFRVSHIGREADTNRFYILIVAMGLSTKIYMTQLEEYYKAGYSVISLYDLD